MVVEKILGKSKGVSDESIVKGILGKPLAKNEVREQVVKAKSDSVGTTESIVSKITSGKVPKVPLRR